MRVAIILSIFLGGCGVVQEPVQEYVPPSFIKDSRVYASRYTSQTTSLLRAYQFINFDEQTHRAELKAFMDIDPVRIEWCAAFINAVLNDSGIAGSESVSRYPLTARSFLDWGTFVNKPQPGDLVIFPRGSEAWQGHVGFYLGTSTVNGKEFYQILGGNQSNKVSIELYPADTAIGIRRHAI